MLAKQEDVGASSRKLDHHASMRMDDQSPTFPLFPFDFLSRSLIILLQKAFASFKKSTSSLAFGSSSLSQPLEFGRALSGVSVTFLFMLSSANDRV